MIDLLYIAGAGRSGSTLLERILGQVDGFVAVGELRHLWRDNPTAARCGCGRLINQCDFWRDVLAPAGIEVSAAGFQRMQAAQRRADRMRHIPKMLALPRAGEAYVRDYAEYTEALRRLYEAIRATSGRRIIVDSSKDISTLYLLTTMADIRVRVLHLVRDSRAVAYSWTRERVRPHVIDEVSYMPVYSPVKSSGDWLYRNILSESARGRSAGYLRMRYEDLVGDPRATVVQVLQFMGLPAADLSFIEASAIQFPVVSHTVAGNPMRFQKDSIELRLDSAWHQEMKPSHRAVVGVATWPLLRRYGYL